MLQALGKHIIKVLLVLNKMAHDVAKQPVEQLESCVDVFLLFAHDQLIDEVDQVLPNGVVLVLLHRTLNLDSQRAHLVDEALGPAQAIADAVQDGKLDLSASLVS